MGHLSRRERKRLIGMLSDQVMKVFCSVFNVKVQLKPIIEAYLRNFRTKN